MPDPYKSNSPYLPQRKALAAGNARKVAADAPPKKPVAPLKQGGKVKR